MKSYCLILSMMVLPILSVIAEPTVSVNSVKQRYPWNGLVDVGMTISNAEDSHLYEVRLSVRANGSEVSVSSNSLEFVLGDFKWPLKNGAYAFTLNLREMFPDASAKNARIIASVLDKGEVPWPADATGDPVGITADVLIVDLSSGSSSSSYPVTSWTSVDTGRFNCDVYKKNKLVVRKFFAGNHIVGYGSSGSLTRVPRYSVSLTNDYYLGLFELTIGQYVSIMGSCPVSEGDNYPVANVPWQTMRGTTSNQSDPTGNGSFLAVLNERTDRNAAGVVKWDLPTETQWEVAVRNDTEYKYVSNSWTDFGNYAWYSSNSGGARHPVGQKLPSVTGLYDCAGNVWEFCLDGWTTYSPSYTDSPNPNGSGFTVRSGCKGNTEEYMQISTRSWDWAYLTGDTAGIGYRISAPCRPAD